MLNCSNCKHQGKQICTVCCAYQGGIPDKWEPRPITYGDKIRSMTDEELAKYLLNRDLGVVGQISKLYTFIYKVDRESCLANILDWLRKEDHDA